MIKKRCKYCDSEFETYKSRKRKFCSQNCSSRWQSDNLTGKNHPHYQKVKINCENCGSVIKVAPCNKDRKKYCSKKCQYEHFSNRFSGKNNPFYKAKIKLECENCKENFQVIPSRADRKFCSENCFNEFLEGRERKNFQAENHPKWKGGYNIPRGANWQAQRTSALKRDNYECQSCGICNQEHKQKHGYELDVHHITPHRKFDNKKKANELSNLITLCRRCHIDIEEGKY